MGCVEDSFYNIWKRLNQHVIYMDAFRMNKNRMKWDESCPDVAFTHNHSVSYLSTLCNDIYLQNRRQLQNQQNQKIQNQKSPQLQVPIIPLMLIAVKVPKHFIV